MDRTGIASGMERRSLHALACLAGIGLLGGGLPAQAAWPDKPIRITVPFVPGGAADSATRLIAPALQKSFGQPVLVENKAGAGAALGTAAVASAPADGYTLLMGSASNAIDRASQRKLPYVFERDLVPVALVAEVPGVLVVPRALPVNTVQDLIAHVKARPAGSVTYGSPGLGTSVHLAGELFQSMTGTTLLHVPYKGAAPALVDLLGSRLHLMFPALAAAQTHVQAGGLRALAVTTRTRTALAPELPTVSEAGLPGYEVGNWIGLFAPAGTAPDILGRLHRAVDDTLKDDAMRQALARIGIEALPGSAQALRERLDGDTQRWAQLIRTRKLELQ